MTRRHISRRVAAAVLACALALASAPWQTRSANAQAVDVTPRGDVTCDGALTADDAAALLGYLVGDGSASSHCPLDGDATANLSVADLDHDGAATLADALLIAQCAAAAEQNCPGATFDTLVWHDDFDGDALDTSRWQIFAGSYGTPYRVQTYRDDPANVRVADGELTLRATYDAATDTYFSGMVTTNDIGQPANPKWAKGNLGWTYGRFEIRAAVPYGRGMWPALWMRPIDNVYGEWPASGEIDILEYLGPQSDNPNAPIERVIANIHYSGLDGGRKQQKGTTPITATSAQEFHVYAVEWTPERLTFSVDGDIFHEVSSWESNQGAFPTPFDQPFDLIFNLQVGGWAGDPVPADFPGAIVIDWVRIWQ